MRKIFICIICSFFIAASAFAESNTTPSAQKVALSAKIANINASLAAVVTKSDAIQNQVTQVQEQVIKLTERLNSVEQTGIANINASLAAVVTKSDAIQNQVTQIQEQVIKLNEQLKKYDLSVIFKKIHQYMVEFSQLSLFAILVAVFLCLLIIYYFLLQLFRCCRSKVPAKKECNFIESKEAEGEEEIAAKLNLARAYIDMGKETEAQTMLNEVVTNGSLSERTEAKELLARIKKS